MSTFIITGATGFVGSHLVHRLVKLKHKVYIICRPSSNLEVLKDIKSQISVYIYDNDIDKLSDFLKATKADCVVHLASLFLVTHEPNQVAELIDGNIKFPSELLEASCNAGIKYFINTGTFWQHYNNNDYDPVCLYGATKEAFENILDYYINTNKIKALTIKLFDTYGENDNRNKLISNLQQISLTGKSLDLSKGQQKMDLTYIEDVIDGYLIAYNYLVDEYKGFHEKFAISSNRLLTLREVLEIFQRETGYKLNVNWGTREYRDREVMIPWRNFKVLPYWKSTVPFEEGVKRIVK